MCADGYDFKIAAGLHRDRLNEAESIRRANLARKAKKEAQAQLAEKNIVSELKYKLGRQLIAIGESLTAQSEKTTIHGGEIK